VHEIEGWGGGGGCSRPKPGAKTPWLAAASNISRLGCHWLHPPFRQPPGSSHTCKCNLSLQCRHMLGFYTINFRPQTYTILDLQSSWQFAYLQCNGSGVGQAGEWVSVCCEARDEGWKPSENVVAFGYSGSTCFCSPKPSWNCRNQGNQS